MAAPTGNQFWKKRSKHGRDRIFATPEILLEAAYEYFEYQSKQSWVKKDFKGKDVVEVDIPTSSPFTKAGLCIFLGVSTSYFREFKRGCSKDFLTAIGLIENIIETQQFEGAAVGAYNDNIIAHELGMKNKQLEDQSKDEEKTRTVFKMPDGQTLEI